jgi:1-phosphofructokinase
VGAHEAALFRRALAAEGLTPALVRRACPTRENLTIFERATRRETHLKGAMPAPDPREARTLLRFLATLPLKGHAVAACGSAPPGTRPETLSAVLALLRRARFLLVDAGGPLLELAARAGVDGLKGNADEIGAWLGLGGPWRLDRSAHRRALLERMASGSRAPERVLITLGPAGAALAQGGTLWHAAAPARPPHTDLRVTGCGDAATAGWLWAVTDGAGPAEVLRRAVASGTAKLLSPDPGLVDPAGVRRLLARVRAVRLGMADRG